MNSETKTEISANLSIMFLIFVMLSAPLSLFDMFVKQVTVANLLLLGFGVVSFFAAAHIHGRLLKINKPLVFTASRLVFYLSIGVVSIPMGIYMVLGAGMPLLMSLVFSILYVCLATKQFKVLAQKHGW